MKILFELKLPQEYLDYDDVENLHYHCINNSSLECSPGRFRKNSIYISKNN